MKKINENKSDMQVLCASVKKLINIENFTDAFKLVYESMAKFPNNPEPHNLLGVLLEKRGEHTLALKHFRIAWVLDPTYEPANQNLSNFGNIYYNSNYAYDEDDCPKGNGSEYQIVYDNKLIGHVEKIR